MSRPVMLGPMRGRRRIDDHAANRIDRPFRGSQAFVSVRPVRQGMVTMAMFV